MPPLRRALLTFGAELVVGWLIGYGLVMLIGRGEWGAIAGFLFGMVLGIGLSLSVGLVKAAKAGGHSRTVQVWLGLLAVPAVFAALPLGLRIGLGGWGTLALMSVPGPVVVWRLAARPSSGGESGGTL
jgi:hypothetical protein